MPKIRFIEVRNFRSIKSLDWAPGEGLNCLIGPGDSGKTSIIDAIEACMSVRRTLTFTDADFFQMRVAEPIIIRVTVGSLPDHLKDLDGLGDVLRGFADNVVQDEPRIGSEVVLTFQLLVAEDLEPIRTLYSQRTDSDHYRRQLPWKERAKLAPSRIGQHSSNNLSWAKGSVLTRLSEEKFALGTELVAAARDARLAFGDRASEKIGDMLDLVAKNARSMGIDVGDEAKALLDVQALSFSDGAITLHSGLGVPLRALGTGSTRLLLSALHREAAAEASCLLLDEVEQGLEPHRVIRLLHSLGSKDESEPLQVFMTTHSAVVVRELGGDQLTIVRRTVGGEHEMRLVSGEDAIQGLARLYPEALLAKTVVVCEGASEVGLFRGVDAYRSSKGLYSTYATATALVDAGGRSPEHILGRARIFAKWGYRVRAFLDADVDIPDDSRSEAESAGVLVCTWDEPFSLEEALFMWLPDYGVDELVKLAIELNSEELVDGALAQVSGNTFGLSELLELVDGDAAYDATQREMLGKAAKLSTKDSKAGPGRKGWFKSVGKMELVGRRVLGPFLKTADPKLKSPIAKLFK